MLSCSVRYLLSKNAIQQGTDISTNTNPIHERIKSTFFSEQNYWLIVSVIIGIVVGFIMSLFFLLIFIVSSVFHYLLGLQLLISAVGGIIIILLIYFKIDQRENNGLSYVINSRHTDSDVPVKVGVTKFFSSGLAIGTGLPVGREAPAMIIGSSIATKIFHLFNLKKREIDRVITLGSAAASGALFQAPFGAAIFAVEVPYKEDSDGPMLMFALVSSVVGTITADLFNNQLIDIFGYSTEIFYLGEANFTLSLFNTLMIVIFGLSSGFIGRLFIKIFDTYTDFFISKFKTHVDLLISLAIFISLSFLGSIFIDDFYLSRGASSFEGIREFIYLNYKNPILILGVAMVIQIFVTSAVITSGFPGGIFGPSLSVGALYGLLFAHLLGLSSSTSIVAWAIIGMAAMHASTTKTPIASVILILEISGLPNLLIPIILANIASYSISGSSSLYKGQISSRDAKILKEVSQFDQHEGFTVKEVMTNINNLEYFMSNIKIKDLRELMAKSGKREFPVIDEQTSKYLGMISKEKIKSLSSENDSLMVKDMMDTDFPLIKSSINGKEALDIMLEADVERAPVVNKNEDIKGIVSIKDIIRGNRQKLDHVELKRNE